MACRKSRQFDVPTYAADELRIRLYDSRFLIDISHAKKI